MTGADLKPVEITGDDVVFWMGCSEEWATMLVQGMDAAGPGDEVIAAEVEIREGDGWGLCTKWRDNIDEQLDGGDPVCLLPDAEYHYKLGLSAERARAQREQLQAAIDVGASAHRITYRLHRSTAESLAGQLAWQVQGGGST